MFSRFHSAFGRSALAALFLFMAAFSASAIAGEIFSRESFTLERRNAAPVTFNVELALTTPQREQGLMNRRAMGENEGMLFDFGENRLVFMWMKNTLLPLDMIFLDQNGSIVHIHENAEPLSETIIPSGQPVRFVLEVTAGTVKRLQIQNGDKARSEQIARAQH